MFDPNFHVTTSDSNAPQYADHDNWASVKFIDLVPLLGAEVPVEQSLRDVSFRVRQHPCIEQLLYSIFSRELVQKHRMFRLLGSLGAEARLASFLLGLADRFGQLGYSRTSFALRMTRQEIGSHLGLKLETVSRALSAFAAAGLIEVDRRAITLSDVDGLRRVVEPQTEDRTERRMNRTQRTAAVQARPAFSFVAPMSLVAA